ncbi:glycosyltransferase family 2 protein [Acidobacteria bacterium AH-259-D05]|nr:glycosyltransferase family 2 protein [Acidobacteria bacterium AH-259-D05]
MKLIIQIPCFNEEGTLPETLADLPREVPGIDRVEWLVVDDGSTDRTIKIARSLGVDHIVSHTRNKGLAAAFQTGLNACVARGADIIVNTDADNQYPGRYVPDLIAPVLAGKADIVIANRQIDRIEHFSFTKKLLMCLGNAVMRYLSGTDVPDAPSGFRVFSREAALRINVLSDYTYTLETIIQAAKKNLTIEHIPIETNPKLRESRLIKSNWRYVMRSAATILRIFLLYEPLRTFAFLGLPFFFLGSVLWVRYVVLIVLEGFLRGVHIPSVVVGAVLILVAVLIWSIGLIGELSARHRHLEEEVLYLLKREIYQSPENLNLDKE